MNKLRDRRGFTLTELVMVMAIAGILAAVGAPAMGGLAARVHASSAESAITSASVARRSMSLIAGAAPGRS